MCVEIEAKLKVESLQEIAEKLTALGAEFLHEQTQTDYYFDDESATLARTDKCLRLRRQLTGRDERTFLTYKGAKEEDEFKKRREVEIEVTNADSAEKLLSEIGYERALVVEKKRQLWRFRRCSVALDELPSLGNFVEIEGPDSQRITDVQRELGLTDLPHIPRSYASLMAEKLGR
ncbi:MAG: class IV adenylate cyclase [Planctomycetota bacterium]|nr:MAG: class IV adenylate cyclase [Planctomycetota bacterium]